MRALGLLALAAGCAMGAEEPALGEPPSRGVGPFSPVENRDGGLQLDEPPFLLSELGTDLTEPSAVALPEGGFRLYFGRAGGIWRADFPDGIRSPTPAPAAALAADQPWEGGRLDAPDVAGGPGGYRMLYEAGPRAAPQLGLAESPDGITWSKRPAPLGGGAAPTWLGDAVAYAAGTEVRRLEPAAVLLLEARAPHGRLRTGATGRASFDLFFECPGRRELAICFAGSFDGLAWERLPGPPVLETRTPVYSPALVEAGGQTILFYTAQVLGKLGIAAALLPDAGP